MFFPFTNYKTVAVDVSNGVSILYTTTAKSVIFFELSSIPVGMIAGVSAFDYSAELLEMEIFQTDGTLATSGQAIVPSGIQVKRSSATTSNTRIIGTLYIFELP